MNSDEKIAQLEESLEISNEAIARLNRRLNNIDEEHARMFLISERIAQQSDMHSLQYSTVEESMCHVLKCMRRQDENIRTVNDNAANLRIYLVKRIEDETKKTVASLEKKMEEKTDTHIRLKLRVIEQEMQAMQIRETETIQKINKLVEKLVEDMQPKQIKKTWKQSEALKFHDEFPSL